MFNNKTKITIELLPGGKFLLETNLNEKDDPALLADFVNKLLAREYLPFLLRSINDAKGATAYKDEIIGNILEFQNKFKSVLINNKKRQPLIRPLNVFNNEE